MRISDISIKNPVFAWMLMFGLMIFGLISFSRMGISQMPDVDFPTVNVSVSLDGAAPEVMETLFILPVARAPGQGVWSNSRNIMTSYEGKFGFGASL